jgi:hypothetical protein
MCLPEDIVSFGGSVRWWLKKRSEWRRICRIVAAKPLARIALGRFSVLGRMSHMTVATQNTNHKSVEVY